MDTQDADDLLTKNCTLSLMHRRVCSSSQCNYLYCNTEVSLLGTTKYWPEFFLTGRVERFENYLIQLMMSRHDPRISQPFSN